MKFVCYAVKVGKTTGVLDSWDKCLESVKGFPGAVYKGFSSVEQADAWLSDTVVESYPKTGLAADGGSKGNPGRMVYKVFDLATKTLVDSSVDAGEGTNNRAEIISIGKASTMALPGTAIYTDSLTAIAWINGTGNPTVPPEWLVKIRDHVSTKKLVLIKWNKNLWGEPPSDCK